MKTWNKTISLLCNDEQQIVANGYPDLRVNGVLGCSSKTAQPKLIVGGVGCGKTFLIKRLQSTIKKDCSKALYPIVIDGKSLYSTNDIWTQCASMLNIEENDDYFNGIIKWQECNLKRVVLFIDNIQYYFI